MHKVTNDHNKLSLNNASHVAATFLSTSYKWFNSYHKPLGSIIIIPNL